ncbi:receptor binding protein [Lactococcus phage 936 group phage PhiF.17]|uniref:Receptor binding protein n=1 Tax=Lactococcus phage 936 group phage PhiF.17 TaxID=1636577 RepID=A0A126HAL6_9CAUD|nr:receptor binding protein [Lactococcus phage 936 group phage PhiF.17]
MTIKNFTFFSPNGTEFPVGSNNDGKLYMMLTGMDYGTIRRKDWSKTLNTALNIQYVNTSIIAGGRYFELLNETVALEADSVNYIHANIDLTQTANPVSLSAETANNSNHVDINNGSGVLKVCFDIVTTSGIGVTSTKPIAQTSALDSISANDMTVSGSINVPIQTLTQQVGNGLELQLTKKNNDLVIVRFFGSVTNIKTGWKMSGTWLDRSFRPATVQSLVGHFAGRGTSFHIDIHPDGSITWWGENIDSNARTPRGNGSYFIK